MSQRLDPPPPMETYSALGNFGTRMFFQLLEEHRNNWEVFQYPNGILPIEAATDSEIVHFLVDQEVGIWESDIPEYQFMDHVFDLMRFLEIAIQGAREKFPQLKSTSRQEVPDPDYELARIFHYYFAQYKVRFSPQLPLTQIPNKDIIEFILQEYNKKPITTPLTHAQAEEQSFQIKLVRFLLSSEGQLYFNSLYERLFESPQKFKPEEQTFILLYWRYKKYWKQRQSLEQAPIADIVRFLSKYYMEFWQQQLSAQNKLGTIWENEVYSIFLTDKIVSNHLENNFTDSETDTETSQEFYRFITPQRKQVTNSQPPVLNEYNRIKHGIITSTSLDPLWPCNFDYIPPPMPSPSPKNIWVRRNLYGDIEPTGLISRKEKQFIQKSESVISSENDDSDKENIPPILENNGGHCCLKRMSEQHTPNGKYGIRTPGDAYPDIAGLISNTTADGEPRPTKHITIWKPGLNIEEKGQKNRNKIWYKRARVKLPKDTKNSLISMQNPPAANQQPHYHPHLDIDNAHTIRNPVTQAELDSASLSIASLSARITGLYFDPNIPDSYFAKAYLPNATLTGYKDGVLKTAEGRAFACIHFDHADRRVFDLAALNAPDPERHMTAPNNAEAPTRLSSTSSTFPPSTTFYQPLASGAAVPTDARSTNSSSPALTSTTASSTQHATTTTNVSCSNELLEPPTATIFHATATRTITPPHHTYPLPPATPYPPLPTFFWNNGTHKYKQLLTHGSTRAQPEDLVTADDTNRNQYTPAEWSFLAQIEEYCRGNEELRQGIKIPEELCAGQYLEGLGEERRVSLQFPMIESLLSCAARTWPTSIFRLFSLFTPIPYNKHGIYPPSNPQLPTPESSTSGSPPSLDTDISSSDPNASTDVTSDDEWAYPLTPPPFPLLEVPQITIPLCPKTPNLNFRRSIFHCDSSRTCKLIQVTLASQGREMRLEITIPVTSQAMWIWNPQKSSLTHFLQTLVWKTTRRTSTKIEQFRYRQSTFSLLHHWLKNKTQNNPTTRKYNMNLNLLPKSRMNNGRLMNIHPAPFTNNKARLPCEER